MKIVWHVGKNLENVIVKLIIWYILLQYRKVMFYLPFLDPTALVPTVPIF